YVSALTSRYQKGIIDENTIRSKLSELNLPSSYIEHIVTIANIKALDKPLTPSKTDILDWYKKDLIDEKQTYMLLSGLGYADEYVKLYIQEANIDKAKKKGGK
ncbi:MAG: hypothetical protein QXN35_06945, partial [Ignisphaera sp.]